MQLVPVKRVNDARLFCFELGSWGGFFLLGDTQPIELQSSTPIWPWALFFLAILIYSALKLRGKKGQKAA